MLRYGLYFTVCVAMVAGCGGSSSAGPEVEAEAHDDEHGSAFIATPEAVRRNLGLTFVEVEARRIEQTLRAPGRFEYLPTARREYRTMLSGRVELLVEQFERVEEGDDLYRIDSPVWRELQQELTGAEAEIQRLESRLASFGPLREAHRAHEVQLERIIGVRGERVRQLEEVLEAGGGRRQELVSARDSVLTAEAELAEVLETEAELEAEESQARSALSAARVRRGLLLETMSAIVSTPAHRLAEADGRGTVRWRSIGNIVVRAESGGVVETIGLTNGAWATQESPVVTVVDPRRLRFRASGLQSDLGSLRDGLTARVVPASTGDKAAFRSAMSAELVVGLSADPHGRTVELYVTPGELEPWVREGVTAQLEVVTDTSAYVVTSIPRSAVQRDGLDTVVFRAAGEGLDVVERVEVALGSDDGRWIEVLEGVRVGDRVVLDGGFQLMLGSSEGMQEGGHFHSDGTFHEGDE